MVISVLRGTAVLAAALVVVLAPTMARAKNVDNGLLETYQPVTHLDPVEQFRPASVQSFVADADLERLDSVRGRWSTWIRSRVSCPAPAAVPGG